MFFQFRKTLWVVENQKSFTSLHQLLFVYPQYCISSLLFIIDGQILTVSYGTGRGRGREEKLKGNSEGICLIEKIVLRFLNYPKAKE